MGGRRSGRGWAVRSFHYAVRWAFLAGIVVWAPVVITAWFFGPEESRAGALVPIVNLALMALAVAGCIWRWIPAPPVFLLQYVVFVFDWAHTAGPSTPFALATYQTFVFAILAQGLVMRRRLEFGFALMCPVVAAVALYLVQPDYGAQISVTIAVTGTCAITFCRPGLLPLLHFAESVDTNHDQSRRAGARLDAQEAAARRAAEEQRTVHDTAINTLAAIVRGGSAVADVEAVRVRCRADSLVLEKLVNAAGPGASASTPPEASFLHRSIDVVMTGLSGAALTEHWGRLPVGVRSALSGAIGELVTNAEKHSGAMQVAVDIRGDGDGLRVVVSDRGRGFSPDEIAERGLASSVRARLAEERVGLELHAATGEGVRAEMVWQPRSDSPRDEGDFTGSVDRIRMIGAVLISALTSGGGIVLGASNHPGEFTPDYLLSVLVVTTTLLSWRSWSRHGRLTDGAMWALVGVAPIAFLISGSSVDFGTGYSLSWQGIAPALPLFILVAGARSGRMIALGVAAYSATAIAAAALLSGTGTASAVTLVILATGLVWVGGWAIFNQQLRRMAARAVREHEMAVRADEAADAQAASALVRARWRLAGIESSAELLRQLATSMDPASAEAQSRSGREETYLRQLILLPPELVHLGAWFCQALSTAREREVNLKVRTGAEDVPTEVADRLGTYLMDVTGAVPPGTEMVASLLDTGDGPQFRLVADDARVGSIAQSRDWGADLSVDTQLFSGQVLVQVGMVARGPALAR